MPPNTRFGRVRRAFILLPPSYLQIFAFYIMSQFVYVTPPSQPQPPSTQGYKKMKWADIPLDKLRISTEQRAALDDIYQNIGTAGPHLRPVDHLFKLDDDSQLNAAAIMAQHGLDLDAREHLSNRWSQQWSRHSGKSPKGESDTRKVLYLCDCGYDHRWNNSKEGHTPVPFTGVYPMPRSPTSSVPRKSFAFGDTLNTIKAVKPLSLLGSPPSLSTP
ncbi:hypothetical protein B0H13DRAFT_2320670 [Mycena leptocephala]|nr:hypothetical protein B0H13DRAFT_2320670 [Mycena leptocephala]